MSAQVLSQIEFSEKLKTLPAGQRAVYMLLTAVSLITMFFLVVVVAVLLMALLSAPLGAPADTIEEIVILGLPIMGAMMISIGMSGSAMPETVLPNETLGRIARRAARGGFISGLFLGFFFGIIWGFVMRMTLIFQTVTDVNMGDLFTEILLYALVMAVVIAPAYALFRAFSSVWGMIALRWFDSAR
jgi:hypothetical protein